MHLIFDLSIPAVVGIATATKLNTHLAMDGDIVLVDVNVYHDGPSE
jgi:hypothetical protein